jgi:hypothetical protein
LLESFALVDLQAAEPFISVGSNDVKVVARGIGGNRARLVFDRIPPVNGRRPNVSGGSLGEFATTGERQTADVELVDCPGMEVFALRMCVGSDRLAEEIARGLPARAMIRLKIACI